MFHRNPLKIELCVLKAVMNETVSLNSFQLAALLTSCRVSVIQLIKDGLDIITL